jgi:hypothetical protein
MVMCFSESLDQSTIISKNFKLEIPIRIQYAKSEIPIVHALYSDLFEFGIVLVKRSFQIDPFQLFEIYSMYFLVIQIPNQIMNVQLIVLVDQYVLIEQEMFDADLFFFDLEQLAFRVADYFVYFVLVDYVLVQIKYPALVKQIRFVDKVVKAELIAFLVLQAKLIYAVLLVGIDPAQIVLAFFA